MPSSGIHHPDSLFSPVKCNNNEAFTSPKQATTDSKSYRYFSGPFRSPPDKSIHPWHTPCTEPWPTTYLPVNATSDCASSSSAASSSSSLDAPNLADDNVANCVTISDNDDDDATKPNEFYLVQRAALNRNLPECNNNLAATSQMDDNAAPSVPLGPFCMHPSHTYVPTSVLPPFVPTSLQSFERRKVHCHRRYHPDVRESKNKSRFSAPGKNTSARDVKMSLSSSPPSPNAGAASGGFCNVVPRSLFQPIKGINPFSASGVFSDVRNDVAMTNAHVKYDSDMSISPVFSSISTSSLSSSSSLSGSSRKRQADEDEVDRNSVCFTNDVITGVGHVKLCDRFSTGSVSPTDPVAFLRDSDVAGQPHKRSKNDNDYDDDVVFVSMQPGPSASKNNLNDRAFSTVPRPKRKTKGTKKASKKRNVISFPATSASNSVETTTQWQITENPFVVPSLTNHTSSSLSNTVGNSASKGYFLRSSVNRHSKKDEQQTDVVCSAASTSDASVSRYQTRSQRKQNRNPIKPLPRVNIPEVQDAPFVPHVHPVANYISTASPGLFDSPDKSSNPCTPDAALSQSIVNTSDMSIHTSPVYAQLREFYDIKGRIGVGGGGTVYAAIRKADGLHVAIKQVPKDKVKRWGTVDGEKVPMEIELLTRATRPHNKGVIQMYEWWELKNCFVLVMEKPRPVLDLFDYLNNKGAMKEKLAKKVFRQIAEALQICHANGVVHRDIKDENVLFNLHTCEAKVIDFGCGTFLKDEPCTEFAGTPEFYPPEWFTERKYYGRRLDAWALGVLLYTMLEAEVPFPKDVDIVKCKLSFKRAHKTTSQSCQNLIMSMLQKDQEKRPTLQQILKHDWLKTNDSEVPRVPAAPQMPAPSQMPVNSPSSTVYLPQPPTQTTPPSGAFSCSASTLSPSSTMSLSQTLVKSPGVSWTPPSGGSPKAAVFQSPVKSPSSGTSWSSSTLTPGSTVFQSPIKPSSPGASWSPASTSTPKRSSPQSASSSGYFLAPHSPIMHRTLPYNPQGPIGVCCSSLSMAAYIEQTVPSTPQSPEEHMKRCLSPLKVVPYTERCRCGPGNVPLKQPHTCVGQ